MQLKLWLLEQEVNCDWDTFDRAVVVAETAQAATEIHPWGYRWGPQGWGENFGTREWCTPAQVKVTCVGDAAPGLKEGQVICYSFKAG